MIAQLIRVLNASVHLAQQELDSTWRRQSEAARGSSDGNGGGSTGAIGGEGASSVNLHEMERNGRSSGAEGNEAGGCDGSVDRALEGREEVVYVQGMNAIAGVLLLECNELGIFTCARKGACARARAEEERGRERQREERTVALWRTQM